MWHFLWACGAVSYSEWIWGITNSTMSQYVCVVRCAAYTQIHTHTHTLREIEKESSLQDMETDSSGNVQLFVPLTCRQALPAGKSSSNNNTFDFKDSQQNTQKHMKTEEMTNVKIHGLHESKYTNTTLTYTCFFNYVIDIFENIYF